MVGSGPWVVTVIEGFTVVIWLVDEWSVDGFDDWSVDNWSVDGLQDWSQDWRVDWFAVIVGSGLMRHSGWDVLNDVRYVIFRCQIVGQRVMVTIVKTTRGGSGNGNDDRQHQLEGRKVKKSREYFRVIPDWHRGAYRFSV